MRVGIRQHLIDNIPELKDCYEPTVPNKDTLKPYAVVLQGSDDDNGDTIGFKRSIEIWIYEKRTTFQKLDKLSENIIKALNLNTITDINTNESFTCIYEGASGQDVIDEEWNAIARGLKFSVIALNNEEDKTEDVWVETLSLYTQKLLNINVYRDTWKKDFVAPCALWRTVSTETTRLNYHLLKINKLLTCHIVSKNDDEITKLIEQLELKLSIDKKIKLVSKNALNLRIVSVTNNKEADMFSKGQLIVKLELIGRIKQQAPIIEHVYGRKF